MRTFDLFAYHWLFYMKAGYISLVVLHVLASWLNYTDLILNEMGALYEHVSWLRMLVGRKGNVNLGWLKRV